MEISPAGVTRKECVFQDRAAQPRPRSVIKGLDVIGAVTREDTWMNPSKLASWSLDLESSQGKSSFVSLALVREQGALATDRKASVHPRGMLCRGTAYMADYHSRISSLHSFIHFTHQTL